MLSYNEIDRVEWNALVGKTETATGIKECIEKAEEIVLSFDQETYKQRHAAWLTTKIDCTAWFTWFIENFPHSERIMRQNPDYQYRFK